MRELGMNAVKLWVQWRWSHRRGDRFQFDDVDRLMDLAAENRLGVTLNVIFDVTPVWLFEEFPDARQVNARGQVIQPYAVGHRQIGGHPGPCYQHPGAREARQRFLTATVKHFQPHPALAMWDVWNEPEQSYQARQPDLVTLTCYCEQCRTGFHHWLKRKYRTMARLNDVWGRCYDAWDEIELPRFASTMTDFVDWREFHLDGMTAEAAWRHRIVRQHDPGRISYLHVVPDVMTGFSAVTCADDFALAELGDCFAATMNGTPGLTVQTVSAARGKRVYNVESHVNYGSFGSHPRILELPQLLVDFLPQVGLGVRGFLFWQFRAEVLGLESPAWGVVNLDGSDRPVTRAAAEFWRRLSPHAAALLECPAPAAAVGVWKSRRNEIAHFAMDLNLKTLADSLEGYVQTLYWGNYPFRFVNEKMLEEGELDGLRLLILPSPLYLSDAEAAALDRWVRAGGVVLCEAHLGAYSATTGRHARELPGGGLTARWGMREADSTAVRHLDIPAAMAAASAANLSADERKAMAAGGGRGGEFLPLTWNDGNVLWGMRRFAQFAGEGLEVLATFGANVPVIVRKRVGRGTVISCGTNAGQAWQHPAALVGRLVEQAATAARVKPIVRLEPAAAGQVHVDRLVDNRERLRFVVALNRSSTPQRVRITPRTELTPVFADSATRAAPAGEIFVPAATAELYVVSAPAASAVRHRSGADVRRSRLPAAQRPAPRKRSRHASAH